MSSSAFFIEAAANTVRFLSCASAGEWIDPNRAVKAKVETAKNGARRCIGRSMRDRGESARKSSVDCNHGMRQAEAPFRQDPVDLRSGGASRSNINRLTGQG